MSRFYYYKLFRKFYILYNNNYLNKQPYIYNMENIENKISELYKIEDWVKKIEEIKNIKSLIQTETDKSNNMLALLDKESTKKYNIDKVINEFNDSSLDKKIKYYQFMNKYINNMEKELFD